MSLEEGGMRAEGSESRKEMEDRSRGEGDLKMLYCNRSNVIF